MGEYQDTLSGQRGLAVLFIQTMTIVFDTQIACGHSSVTFTLSPPTLFTGLIGGS